jgi:hypothetical protein
VVKVHFHFMTTQKNSRILDDVIKEVLEFSKKIRKFKVVMRKEKYGNEIEKILVINPEEITIVTTIFMWSEYIILKSQPNTLETC